ncbi:hypothetical protein FACS189499_09940 [Clostridia bacterium]|nr:hypothetical protein FACS189499_09940 [Clostridia bacterium]
MTNTSEQTKYFHADTDRFRKQCRLIIAVSFSAVYFGGVLAFLLLFVNLRTFAADGTARTLLIAAGIAALSEILFAWGVYSFTVRKISNSARYTYADITEGNIIYSSYAGDRWLYGEKFPLRELSVVPLKGLSGAGKDVSTGAVVFLCRDDCPGRFYHDTDEKLGYHIRGGVLDFDNWWYNENGFRAMSSVRIPNVFSDPDALLASALEAKRKFDAIPPPKPYVHKEPEFLRRERQKKMQELMKTLSLEKNQLNL